MADQRSEAAALYRRWYGTARWKRIREAQLMSEPLCEWCLQMEVIEPATVVHHSEGGHKGNEYKFWNGPFASLCKACHDRDGQREDLGQTIVTFGADGWPVDCN